MKKTKENLQEETIKETKKNTKTSNDNSSKNLVKNSETNLENNNKKTTKKTSKIEDKNGLKTLKESSQKNAKKITKNLQENDKNFKPKNDINYNKENDKILVQSTATEGQEIDKNNTQNKPKKCFLKKLNSYFTLYEKIWFTSIVVISVIMAFLFPVADVNGFNGTIIMALYLFDVVVAVLCELLTSKQSKWSFFIYNFVEIAEIVILIMLKARFATLAVSIFVWIPLHIISFINWSKHPDKVNKELTTVRSLKWWQSLILVLISIVWTFGIGYLTAAYAPETDFYSAVWQEKAVAYLDACVSIVQIINGILLYFRFKENWLVWYMSIVLETIINIISGQWILLVLKVGYITNTTYGYIKWTKYIKNNTANVEIKSQSLNKVKSNK